jgi:hypothetical protein
MISGKACGSTTLHVTYWNGTLKRYIDEFSVRCCACRFQSRGTNTLNAL